MYVYSNIGSNLQKQFGNSVFSSYVICHVVAAIVSVLGRMRACFSF